MENIGLTFLGILMFLVSVFMMMLILLQRGKGGGLTGALGGMGGQSAFGSKAGDVFTKITVVTAIIWITLCMITIAAFNPPPRDSLNTRLRPEASMTSTDEDESGEDGSSSAGSIGGAEGSAASDEGSASSDTDAGAALAPAEGSDAAPSDESAAPAEGSDATPADEAAENVDGELEKMLDDGDSGLSLDEQGSTPQIDPTDNDGN